MPSLDLKSASSPYGGYTLDRNVKYTAQLDDANTGLKCIHSSSGVSLWLHKDYILKDYLSLDDSLSDIDPDVMMIVRARSELQRVLEIISAAGDCSVPIVGRRFKGEHIQSYMMPIETIITSAYPNRIEGPKRVELTSKDERRAFIDQLVALVDRLHSRKIIHGDIKTANLLMCSDGQIRFCDFDDARFENDAFVNPYACSPPYASWRRSVFPYEPPTYAEDRHAMGMIIYEIYTGTIPLGDGIVVEYSDSMTESESEDHLYDALDERSELGLWPNLGLVDDPDIMELIRRCLEGCSPPPAQAHRLPMLQCVEMNFGFRDCHRDPVHAYSRVVHCPSCPTQFSRAGESCKVKLFRPSASDISIGSRCPYCNPDASWSFFS